jgi:acyl-homoserine lactone synthase
MGRDIVMHAIIVDESNQHLHGPALDSFFRERHCIYAEELHWVPCATDGREIDQFDTPAATYILILEGTRLIAGSRLITTDQPHLASEVFADAFNQMALPRDPKIVEWTRGFIVGDQRERGSLKLKAFCCAAVMEYCLGRGYRQIGGMQDKRWLSIWRRLGWRVHVHGDPVLIDGHDWTPAYFDVTEDALQAAQGAAGLAVG